MPAYKWTGIFQNGTSCHGKLEAESSTHVQEILLSKNIALLSCSPAITFNILKFKKFEGLLGYEIFAKKITFAQLLPFFEHMNILVKSGIPLLSSLKISGQQLATQQLQATIKEIVHNVERGESLAHALQKHPATFTLFITHLIGAGEQAGKLSLVFENLSLYFKRRIELEKKIKQATLLPFITLGFALCIFIIIFALIIPQFSTLFTALNKPLPAITKTVLAISACFTTNILLIFFTLLILFVFLAKKALRISRINHYKDALVLKIPLISSIVLLTNLVRFLRIVSMFLKSGITLTTALEKAAKSIDNTVLQANIEAAHHAVMQGKSLEQAFSTKNNYLPTELIALMSVGEQTGTLELMLDKAADFLQDKLSTQLELLTTVIQPILLIITGIIVAGLMLAVYLPIFGMASVL